MALTLSILNKVSIEMIEYNDWEINKRYWIGFSKKLLGCGTQLNHICQENHCSN